MNCQTVWNQGHHTHPSQACRDTWSQTNSLPLLVNTSTR
jgi:hypothetical protein